MSNEYSMEQIFEQTGIERLIILEDYLDFAISSTIKKQFSNIDIDSEKECAKMVIYNWLVKNRQNAFTSSFDIRMNMNKCDRQTVLQVLFKSAIEKEAYKTIVEHKLQNTNEVEKVCQHVNDNIYDGKYDQVIEELQNDKIPIEILIENYVDFTYRSSAELKGKCMIFAEQSPITAIALQQLNLEMSLQNLKRR